MDKISTEKILTLIRDNIDLPFYIFVSCDDVDFYEYSSVIQEVESIDIDYIWADDDNRIYIKSWDEDELVDEFYNNMTDEWLEEHGFSTEIPMSTDESDRLYKMCYDMVQSLNWEKCIVGWSSNP